MGLRIIPDLSGSRKILILYSLSYVFAFSTCVVAGFQIQTRFAADFNDRVSNTTKLHSFEQPGNVFLQSRSPGLFLSVKVPKGTTFLRLYGLRQASGSLYGVCLDCGGNYTLIDGSNAVPQSASELFPSCIFSLSVDRTTTGPLELYNIPKNRSNSSTILTFSYVEFFLHNQDQLPTYPQFQPCECHLNTATTHKMRPREGPPANDTSQVDWWHQVSEHRNGQMNVLIGLLSTLVTMVVLVVCLAAYHVFRRRLDHFHHMLDNLHTSEEAALGPSSSDKISSIPGHPDTKKYEHFDSNDTGFTASSFSTRTELDSTREKAESNLRTVPSRSALVSSASRLPSVSRQKRRLEPPKFAPPTQALPVPNEPVYPEKSKTRESHIHVRSGTGNSSSSLRSSAMEKSPASHSHQVGHNDTTTSRIPLGIPKSLHPSTGIHQTTKSAPPSLPPNVRHPTSHRPSALTSKPPKVVIKEATPLETLKMPQSAPPSLPPKLPNFRRPDPHTSRFRPPELASNPPTIAEEAASLTNGIPHSRQHNVALAKWSAARNNSRRVPNERKRTDSFQYHISSGETQPAPEQRLRIYDSHLEPQLPTASSAAFDSKEHSEKIHPPNRAMLADSPHPSVEIPADLLLFPLPSEFPTPSKVQPLKWTGHKRSTPVTRNPSVGVSSTKDDLPSPPLLPKSEPDNNPLEGVAISIAQPRRRALPKLPSLS